MYDPDYYHVCLYLYCPIVMCDDWTEEPNHIWHSYVVFPTGIPIQAYVQDGLRDFLEEVV